MIQKKKVCSQKTKRKRESERKCQKEEREREKKYRQTRVLHPQTQERKDVCNKKPASEEEEEEKGCTKAEEE